LLYIACGAEFGLASALFRSARAAEGIAVKIFVALTRAVAVHRCTLAVQGGGPTRSPWGYRGQNLISNVIRHRIKSLTSAVSANSNNSMIFPFSNFHKSRRSVVTVLSLGTNRSSLALGTARLWPVSAFALRTFGKAQ
jgi:hypothetical protein